jgi:hypothetical protein
MSNWMPLDALMFCVQNLLAVLAAYLFAVRAFEGCDRFHLTLAMVAGYPLVAYFTVLLLGSVGLLSIGPVLIVLSALNALLFWGPGFPKMNSLRKLNLGAHVGPAGQSGGASGNPIAASIALALVVVFVLPPVIRLLGKGPSFGSDDFSYHAPFAAQWLVEGRIGLIGSSLSTYYPFNSEIFSLWHMLPFRADGFVGLVGVFWIGLLAFSVFTLARRMEVALHIAGVCVALMIASPVVAVSAGRFSSVDFAGAVAMLCALVFFLDARLPATSHTRRRSDLVYGGLLAGFATGVKVPFAVPCGVILLWILFSGGGSRVRSALLTLFSMSVAGGYWYVRNLIFTGNPVYPADNLLFSGPFGAAEQTRTKLITWIINHPADLQQWKYIAYSVFDWPFVIGILACLGYAITLFMLFRSKGRLSGYQVHFCFLLCCVGIAGALTFPFMPFSGTDNDPNGLLRIEPRFLILSFLLGVVLLLMLLGGHQRGQRFVFGLSVVAVIGVWDGPLTKLAMLMAVTAALLVVPQVFWGSLRKWLDTVRGGSVLAFLVAAAVCILQPVVQRNADAEMFSYQWKGRPLGEAWRAVASLPLNSQIACFGASTDQYYPLFGRHLDKVPVPLQQDGTVRKHLHELSRVSGDGSSYWAPEPELRLDHLVTNLRRSGVAYALVVQEEPGVWPGQHVVLSQTPGATRVFDNGYACIWKLPVSN